MEKNRNFSIVFKYGGYIALKVGNFKESWLWRKRFGHLNFYRLKLLSQNNVIVELSSCIENKEGGCEVCALGKHHRQPFPRGVARKESTSISSQGCL